MRSPKHKGTVLPCYNGKSLYVVTGRLLGDSEDTLKIVASIDAGCAQERFAQLLAAENELNADQVEQKIVYTHDQRIGVFDTSGLLDVTCLNTNNRLFHFEGHLADSEQTFRKGVVAQMLQEAQEEFIRSFSTGDFAKHDSTKASVIITQAEFVGLLNHEGGVDTFTQSPGHQLYVFTGRLLDDDEDMVDLIAAENRDAAHQSFMESLAEDSGMAIDSIRDQVVIVNELCIGAYNHQGLLMIDSHLELDVAEVLSLSGDMLPAETREPTDAEAKNFVLEMLEGESISQYQSFESFFAALTTFSTYEGWDNDDPNEYQDILKRVYEDIVAEEAQGLVPALEI